MLPGAGYAARHSTPKEWASDTKGKRVGKLTWGADGSIRRGPLEELDGLGFRVLEPPIHQRIAFGQPRLGVVMVRMGSCGSERDEAGDDESVNGRFFKEHLAKGSI